MKKILFALALLLLFASPVHAYMLEPQVVDEGIEQIETTLWMDVDNIFSSNINYAIARFKNVTDEDYALNVTTYYADEDGVIFGAGVSECLYLAAGESFWDVLSIGGETFCNMQLEINGDEPSQSMKEAFQVSSLDLTQNSNGSVEYTAHWDSNHGMRILLLYLDENENPVDYYTVGLYGQSPLSDYVDSPSCEYSTCLGTFNLE